MINKEKLKQISKTLTSNPSDFASSFRKNLFKYVEDKEITLSQISEASDIPFSTLDSFLYGKTNNVRIDKVVKLARALDVSIDELVGAGTIDPITKESLNICRDLPEHALYLVRYFIRHQEKIYKEAKNPNRTISVLTPQCNNGALLTTNVLYPLELTDIPDYIKSKVYIGLQIPCEHYMPHYAPKDVILIAADREATNGDRCVVTFNGEIYIVIKKSYTENGIKKYKYVSLINENFEISQENIDDKVGYIVGFLNPDYSYGAR